MSGAASFDAATDAMILHFDSSLTEFQTDVHEGNANVRVVSRSSSGGAGAQAAGGTISGADLAALAALVLIASRRPIRRRYR
jgi:hypothetical protein